MKIIYEKGDVVEIVDEIGVPNDMGACFVELTAEISPKIWTVKIVESYDDILGTTGPLHERWFLT